MPEKCQFCDTEVTENDAMCSDEYSLQPDAILCQSCYGDDEIVASVKIFKPDGSHKTLGFGEVTTIETDEDGACGAIEDAEGWSFGYVRTDGWRGYYDEVVPDGWARLDTDGCALMMSEQADRLVDLDTRIRAVAVRLSLEVARVTARTSNVCSMGYSLYVKGDKGQAERLLAEAESYVTTV